MPPKVEFIHAKAEVKVEVPEEVLKKLPRNLCLVTTIQHLDQVQKLKEKIGAVAVARVLGCSATSAQIHQNRVNAYLYIGTGDFHPIEVGLRTKKPVYIFSPISKELKLLDPKKLEAIEKRKKSAYMAFLTKNNIGILVTTKSGQNNIQTAWQLKDYIKEKFPEKNVYIFGGNTIDFTQLENFPFIDVWVNTMCPRISTDDSAKFAKPIIDARELKSEQGLKVPNLISTFS